ncbi:hypothetical protein [Saccharothrix australiensis]|uniref:Uncharacterized protein n=1 Tax=Saccharothrix australiensis TaxID=2072 RepID=A0A495W513_9PSEU|nr:hypothetical protein [Saccharothrix australiensis]RKT56220.1 hypothetical protein C8E97_4909 [Saccharothrix australiensis]
MLSEVLLLVAQVTGPDQVPLPVTGPIGQGAPPPVAQATTADHDAGVRHVAQLSARPAYAAMCATPCWAC